MIGKFQVKNLLQAVTKRVVLIGGVFFSAFLFFAIILNEVVIEKESAFDKKIFNSLADVATPALTQFFLFITFFGSQNFLLPAYILLCCYFLFIKKDTRLTIDIVSLGISSAGILILLKNIVERKRPLDPLVKSVTGFSFPSGHTFSSFVFFGMLIYITWQFRVHPGIKWVLSVLFLVLAFSVGASRVYLHVHFPTDVIAGFCLSIIWLTFSFWVLRKLNLAKN